MGHRLHRLVVAALLAVVPVHAGADGPDRRAILDGVSADSIRAFHDRLAHAPHIAGTPGDRAVVEYLVGAFTDMGLEVERQELLVPLPQPGEALLEVVQGASGGTESRTQLTLTEPALEGDPDTAHPDLTRAWNAWSGSGDATAPVVYANYGRKEDFEKLVQLGVDPRGCVVIARYGGNFRGMKAKYAEAFGAVGLVIYTDPADNGYMQGLPWPEGGFASEFAVQRGSVSTLDYPGDPFSPFFASTPGQTRARLDDAAVPLARIPVQPVGWGAAREILARMKGPVVPPGAPGSPGAWQGGLPFTYRLSGGPELKVRLKVDQPRREVTTWNVIATLRGSESPDERVILGCHHDAWCFGAQDPTSGTMLLMELARVFAEAAKAGHRPKRTIQFCAWAAEEFSIVGSTEWVEADAERLRQEAIAYINLDAAVFGLNFSGSAAPALKPLIAQAAREVYTGETAAPATAPNEPPGGADHVPARPVRLGDMGGGSDHVGFWSHLATPSCGLGAGGARGHAYHSNYDTLKWWRSVVGEDYLPGVLVARVGALIALRLADDPALPLDASQPMLECAQAAEAIAARAKSAGGAFDATPLRDRATSLEKRATLIEERVARALDAGALGADRLVQVNRALRSLGRAFYEPAGLPDRPWHRNLYASPDETSGYGAWVLPALRRAVDRNDSAGVEEAASRLQRALDAYESGLEEIDRALK